MNFTRAFRSVYWLYIAIIAVAIFCGKNPVIQLEMMSPGNGNEQTDLCCCHVFGRLRLFIYAIVAALLKYNRFPPQV